ncbi:MAG: polymerase subunit delta [Francisellaceae bacterium]|nr:polymerase subunit delta [Francisellaceae bacterium]
MNIVADQLKYVLNKKLESLYVFIGQEPLLLRESKDLINNCANTEGFTNRESYQINAQFDWEHLKEDLNCYSLFSNKRYIELDFGEYKLSNSIQVLFIEFLNEWLNNPDILICCYFSKVDNTQLKNKFFTGLDKLGILILINPISLNQYPNWIMKRLKVNDYEIEPAALQTFVYFTEGNLLNAQQTIEKLKLLYPPGILTEKHILSVVTDFAQYNLFEFIDCCLKQEQEKIVHMLNSFKNQGLEPTLLLWAITRELRLLLNISIEAQDRVNLQAIMTKYRVWQSRQPLIIKALAILNKNTLYTMLLKAQKIDNIIKGVSLGSVWNELIAICLQLGGINLQINNIQEK